MRSTFAFIGILLSFVAGMGLSHASDTKPEAPKALQPAQKAAVVQAFRAATKRHALVYYVVYYGKAILISSTIDGEYEMGEVFTYKILGKPIEYRYYAMPYPHVEAAINGSFRGVFTDTEVRKLVSDLSTCSKRKPEAWSDREIAVPKPFPIHKLAKSHWQMKEYRIEPGSRGPVRVR